MIKLTEEQEGLAKRQCYDCIFWSASNGCCHTDAITPSPAKNCRARTKRIGEQQGRILIWLTTINENLPQDKQLWEDEISYLAEKLSGEWQ